MEKPQFTHLTFGNKYIEIGKKYQSKETMTSYQFISYHKFPD